MIKIYSKYWEIRNTFVTSYGKILGGNNFYICISDGKYSGWGEASPNPSFKKGKGISYSNLNKKVLDDLKKLSKIISTESIKESIISRIQTEISQISPEAKAAFDCAIYDYLLKKNKKYFIKLKQNTSKGLFSLSIGSIDKNKIVSNTLKNKDKFRIIKYKINKENYKHIPWKSLLKNKIILDFDGNREELRLFLEYWNHNLKYSKLDIYLEEPLNFNNVNLNELKRLYRLFDKKIIFDDSILNFENAIKIREKFPEAILNMKIQKLGGITPILKIIKKIGNKNIMIGCVYETSLSICAGAFISKFMKNPIIDLDADIYTGLSKNSPKIKKHGRIPVENFGIGYIPSVKKAKIISTIIY